MFLDEKMLEMLYKIKPEQSVLKKEVLSLYYLGYAQTLVEFVEKAYAEEPEVAKALNIDKLKVISQNINTQENFEEFMTMLAVIGEVDPLLASRFEHVQELYNEAIIKNRTAKLSTDEIKNLQKYIAQKFHQTEDLLYVLLTRYLKNNDDYVENYIEVSEEEVEETPKV